MINRVYVGWSVAAANIFEWHRGVVVLKKLIIIVVLIASCSFAASVALAGGGVVVPQRAQLDPTLMAFKDQGVWYFPCEAPIFNPRIPPHYVTYGPPPPPYCCPPVNPGIPNSKPARF